jgi:hypothetical protein
MGREVDYWTECCGGNPPKVCHDMKQAMASRTLIFSIAMMLRNRKTECGRCAEPVEMWISSTFNAA